MKFPSWAAWIWERSRFFSIVVLLSFSGVGLHAETTNNPPADPALEELGQAVVELLNERNTDQFTRKVVASIEDWKGIVSTNVAAAEDGNHSEDQANNLLKRHHTDVTASASNVLAQAKALGIDTNNVRFTLREIRRATTTSTRRSLATRNNFLPWTEFIYVSLEGQSAEDPKRNGEYKLTLHDVLLYPQGWRIEGGVTWKDFPAGAVDPTMRQNMQILEKVSKREPITGDDDPLLKAWAEKVLKFVQHNDAKTFEKEVLPSVEDIYAFYQSVSPGKGPTKEQFAASWKEHTKKIIDSAKELLAQSEKFGLNFKDATIALDKVTVEQLRARRGAGQIVGIEGNVFEIVFQVKTDGKTKEGNPLAGEYRIAGGEMMRLEDQWFLEEPLRWSKLPPGILSGEDEKAMEVENYVGKKGRLPPGYPSPDAEIVKLSDRSKAKLSDYRGKVLLIDFWATWCGPCQQPMAELQTIVQKHPEWKDKVVFMSVSIDESVEKLNSHIAKQGWTNTFNVWAGPGEWSAPAPKAYRVSGVPSSYVINGDGVITWSGHPAGGNMEQLIKDALK